MNILQMLFGKRSESLSIREALAQPPHEAWKTLERMGYTVQRVKHPSDPEGRSSYRMLDSGIPVTEWEHGLTVEASVKRREVFAKMEIKRLAELEKESE